MVEPEIFTERLWLSRLLSSDAIALFEYRSDPDVCRYQTFEPGSLDDAKKFIRELEGNVFGTPKTWFQFGIRLREDGLLAGDIGIHFSEHETRQVEIGFTIASRHQGCGYGTEAVKGVLAYLFDRLKIHRVFASVDPRNEPCIALLKRVGMRQEAHFRQSLWFKGEWVDDVMFGILESEWVGSFAVGVRRVSLKGYDTKTSINSRDASL
jgi:RimJ/RimL family protein N-acetyltransferase